MPIRLSRSGRSQPLYFTTKALRWRYLSGNALLDGSVCKQCGVLFPYPKLLLIFFCTKNQTLSASRPGIQTINILHFRIVGWIASGCTSPHHIWERGSTSAARWGDEWCGTGGQAGVAGFGWGLRMTPTVRWPKSFRILGWSAWAAPNFGGDL